MAWRDDGAVAVTCWFGSCTRWARARANFTTPSRTSTSTRDISTTMAPIDDAIADLESREEDEKFTFKEVADCHGVERSTLSRRWRGLTGSRTEGYEHQQLLNPQQEAELVQYIEDLTAKALPPTRTMIRNFASEICGLHVGVSWITRFLHRHHDLLLSKWSVAMDSNRHAADSYEKYSLYFDLLHSKMSEYKILPCNTYNMDEKGFMIGVIGRSKRVFSKQLWESKEITSAIQDGSRDWVTVVAAVCADGTALPPGIIYTSANSTIQQAWVTDVEVNKHHAFFGSSASGWTNNELSLAWLEQVFDRHTKKKARHGRDWRLLILDGHGSHVTSSFFEYCLRHSILLLIYPPHSTHTLQPLDVVMFKPLASAYTKALTNHTQQSQGLVPVKIGDFFGLFWEAWVESFKKETILQSFLATGIWPKNRIEILKRYSKKKLGNAQRSEPTINNEWIRIERVLRAAVGPVVSDEAKKLSTELHHLAVQNSLIHLENEGLRSSLDTHKKRKKEKKALDIQPRKEYWGGAHFYSPRKIREAQFRDITKTRDKDAEALRKQTAKELRESNSLLKKKLDKEKAEKAAKLKDERERLKAEKEAERERKQQAKNTTAALKTAQSGKRKALRASYPKAKRARGDGVLQSLLRCRRRLWQLHPR
jgi:hypothetical protein